MSVMGDVFGYDSSRHGGIEEVALAEDLKDVTAGSGVLEGVVVNQIDSKLPTQRVQFVIRQKRPRFLAGFSRVQPIAVGKFKAFKEGCMAHALPVKIPVVNDYFAIACLFQLRVDLPKGGRRADVLRLDSVNLNVPRQKRRIGVDQRAEFRDDAAVFEQDPAYLANGASVGIARFDVKGEKSVEHDGLGWLDLR